MSVGVEFTTTGLLASTNQSGFDGDSCPARLWRYLPRRDFFHAAYSRGMRTAHGR